MNKPYHEMTAAERLADRIAKNREIDQRVIDTKAADKKKPTAVSSRSKSVRSALDEFQRIKNTQGIDAASDFVLDRKKG